MHDADIGGPFVVAAGVLVVVGAAPAAPCRNGAVEAFVGALAAPGHGLEVLHQVPFLLGGLQAFPHIAQPQGLDVAAQRAFHVPNAGIDEPVRVAGEHEAGAAAPVGVVLFVHGAEELLLEEGAVGGFGFLRQEVGQQLHLPVEDLGVLQFPALLVDAVGVDLPVSQVVHVADGLVGVPDVAGGQGDLAAHVAAPAHPVHGPGHGQLVAGGAVGEDPAGIVEGLVPVDGNGEGEPPLPPAEECLHLRVKVLDPVGADGDHEVLQPGVIQLDAPALPVVQNLPDQLYLEEGLPSDELQDDGGAGHRVDVVAVLRGAGKEPVREGLAHLQRHDPLSLVSLVAVGAGQVAAIRDLPGNGFGEHPGALALGNAVGAGGFPDLPGEHPGVPVLVLLEAWDGLSRHTPPPRRW